MGWKRGAAQDKAQDKEAQGEIWFGPGVQLVDQTGTTAHADGPALREMEPHGVTPVGGHALRGAGRDEGSEEEIAALVNKMEIDTVPTMEGDSGLQSCVEGGLATGGQAVNADCRGMFRDIQTPILPAPPASPPRSTTARAVRPRKTMEAKRSSMRLAAKPSSVPVAERAQHKLRRELDFIKAQETVPDAAVTQYVDKYDGELPDQAVWAIRAATCLGNKKLAKVLAALAAEAEAVEMEI